MLSRTMPSRLLPAACAPRYHPVTLPDSEHERGHLDGVARERRRRLTNDRYEVVLGLLVLDYMMSAVGVVKPVLIVVNTVCLAVAWGTSGLRRRGVRVAAVVLLLTAVPLGIALLVGENRSADALESLWRSIILLMTLLAVLRRVL